MMDTPVTDVQTAEPSGSAVIEIFLDGANNAFFLRGRFTDLFAAYRQHVHFWEKLPVDPALSMFQQVLAAAVLHLCCRNRNELTAWTLNLQSPPLNLFVTLDNGASTVTGRVISEDVKTVSSSRLFLNMSGVGRERIESVIEVEGLDILNIFEQYYRKSEQIQARLFDLGKETFALVFGLPEISSEWMSGLSRETVRARLQEPLEKVESRLFRFECGCNPARVLQVIRSLFEKKVQELFGQENKVEIHCPRCGRRWWISREDFLNIHSKVGAS
jgi:molecular chaperone Hsp33